MCVVRKTLCSPGSLTYWHSQSLVRGHADGSSPTSAAGGGGGGSRRRWLGGWAGAAVGATSQLSKPLRCHGSAHGVRRAFQANFHVPSARLKPLSGLSCFWKAFKQTGVYCKARGLANSPPESEPCCRAAAGEQERACRPGVE